MAVSNPAVITRLFVNEAAYASLVSIGPLTGIDRSTLLLGILCLFGGHLRLLRWLQLAMCIFTDAGREDSCMPDFRIGNDSKTDRDDRSRFVLRKGGTYNSGGALMLHVVSFH
jgi:hypothetical protein